MNIASFARILTCSALYNLARLSSHTKPCVNCVEELLWHNIVVFSEYAPNYALLDRLRAAENSLFVCIDTI